MITDEMLRVAAARSSEAFVRYIEQDYDSEHPHKFSPAFEKKIKKLKCKADHSVLYRTLQRVASIVLAILIGGGVWLTVDIEARAAFVGWIKEIYETYFVYRFEDDTNSNIGPIEYRPTWLPDGYSEFFVDDTEDTVFVVYANDAGQMMNFSYICNPDETKWLVDRNNAIVKQTYVNENTAELFVSIDSNNASAIVWTTTDNTAFYLSAFLSDAELLQIAGSVQPIE